MKKILFVTTKYTKGEDFKWLTNEVAEYAQTSGYDVNVLCLNWQSAEEGTEIYDDNGVSVTRFSLPKFFYRKNIISKIFKLLSFSFIARLKLRPLSKNVDVMLMTSPCIATWAFCFSRRNTINVLILWDFFPYFMSGFWGGVKRSFVPLLSSIEGVLYKQFNSIGVMTPGAKDFLKDNYSLHPELNIFHFPLWSKIEDKKLVNKLELREKLGFYESDFIVIYGGAITKVQQLENLINLANATSNKKNLKYLILGNGPEYPKIESMIQDNDLTNVTLLNAVSRVKYEEYISMSDVGFVSLSANHKVPSFPSKSVDYFKVSLPVLASIDEVTDYGHILENEIKAGFFVKAGEIPELHRKLTFMMGSPQLLVTMGNNGRVYYENNMRISKVFKLLESNF